MLSDHPELLDPAQSMPAPIAAFLDAFEERVRTTGEAWELRSNGGEGSLRTVRRYDGDEADEGELGTHLCPLWWMAEQRPGTLNHLKAGEHFGLDHDLATIVAASADMYVHTRHAARSDVRARFLAITSPTLATRRARA